MHNSITPQEFPGEDRVVQYKMILKGGSISNTR